MTLRAAPLVRVRRHADPRVPVYVRRQAHTQAIVDLLARHLTPVQARIRGRMLDAIAQRVVERHGEVELFFELDEPAQLIATVLHVRHVVPHIEEDHTKLVYRFDRLAEAHDALESAPERRQLLADYLRQTVTNRWKLRKDRAALRRHLDLEALRERNDTERHQLLVSIELSLDFIRGALRSIAEAEPADIASALDLLRNSDLSSFLLGCADSTTRWQTRRSALEALESLAATGTPLTSHELERIGDRLLDRREHPWVAAACIDVLWCADPPTARSLTEQRLLEPDSESLGFVLRRLLIDRVHRDSDWALQILGDPAILRDPSEYARQGIGLAAGRLLPEYPAALDLLGMLLGAADQPADSSPRVRAVAAQALSTTAVHQPQLAPASVELLRAFLLRDRESLPLRVACDELRQSLEQWGESATQGPPAHLEPLVPALVELSTAGSVSAAVHETAAAVLETYDRVSSPGRNRLLKQLRDAIKTTDAPGSCRVTVADDTPRQDIGRALAELSRDDWGLSASVRGNRLRLSRGDRFVTKLWRVLHELRNPAPNKRQGYRHTVGRALRGEVRAPSGQLHEVTPTVVPGERVHIDGEGGWGRHVPSVDDVTSLPLWKRRPIEIYSSFGVTRIRSAGTLGRRLWSRIRMALRYSELAEQRSSSLDAVDTDDQKQYLTTLRDRYGVEVEIETPPPISDYPRQLPARVSELMPPAPKANAAFALAPGVLSPGLLLRLDEWIDAHAHYFLTMQANHQASLASFFVGAFALFLGDSYRRRRSLDRTRAQIPLCIGGWGTRGKSGTERIKAGLFHGLGFQVFSKTTGCEAMMIHSVPEGPSSEIFVFRPYGKATIWEQRNLLELGAALRADVFLWECMALRPKYVEVLQHQWMRDDIATLTNAYPDHEDIQGPAGVDVAETISSFIPRRSTVITSEINFLPLFREVCRKQQSELLDIGPYEGDLISTELLDLYPYAEHPRNIALVARMAKELGIDPELAIVTMAQHVVPDLGVLKSYPPVNVRGRILEFINGCSANERAGFLGNWERTGCAALADSDDPRQVVITVVNNRDDRISRSEVFARILVNDTVVDRHVLIGTNLRGLQSYLRASMASFLRGLQLVAPADLDDEAGRARAVERLDALMRRLRICTPDPSLLLAHLRTYAAGCGLKLSSTSEAALTERIETLLHSEGSLELAAVRRELTDAKLSAAIDDAVTPRDEAPEHPEVFAAPEATTFVEHFERQLARSIIHARLRRQLAALSASGVAGFETSVRDVYKALFDETIVVIEDPKTKGDAIILACANCTPPGTHVRIMGTQNIKGTGLDFVYRWLALDTVTTELNALDSGEGHERLAALERLRAFADHGVVDLGLLEHYLNEHEPRGKDERPAFERLRAKVQPDYARRKAALMTSTSERPDRARARRSWTERIVGRVEQTLDFLDGIRRFHDSAAIAKDLIHGRISHPKAAMRMREIYAREKGGWLLSRLTRKA